MLAIVTAHETQPVTVVRLIGSLSSRALEDFEVALTETLGDDGGRVVFDMERVSLLCSGALGLLVHHQQRFTAPPHAGRIHIANPGLGVEQVLRISQISKLMPIHPTVDAAAAAFNRATP